MALAQFTTYDFTSQTNESAEFLYHDPFLPHAYPLQGATYDVGAIPFLASGLSSLPYDSTPYTGEGIAILGPSYNYFASLNSVVIPVSGGPVESVYTEINSAFGSPGALIGDVELVGSTGTVTYDLIEDYNVRDHFFGSFTNTVTEGINSTAYWLSPGVPTQVSPGNQDSTYVDNPRNDVQGWVVPSSIGALENVTISYAGDGNYGDGDPILFGITTSSSPLAGKNSAPTPGPAAVIPYLIGIAAAARRRKA